MRSDLTDRLRTLSKILRQTRDGLGALPFLPRQDAQTESPWLSIPPSPKVTSSRPIECGRQSSSGRSQGAGADRRHTFCTSRKCPSFVSGGRLSSRR